MEYINITNTDIVKGMTENQKHNLAMACIVSKTEPEEVISLVKNMVNLTINLSIDLCNNYLKLTKGKQYLEMREKINNCGSKASTRCKNSVKKS